MINKRVKCQGSDLSLPVSSLRQNRQLELINITVPTLRHRSPGFMRFCPQKTLVGIPIRYLTFFLSVSKQSSDTFYFLFNSFECISFLPAFSLGQPIPPQFLELYWSKKHLKRVLNGNLNIRFRKFVLYFMFNTAHKQFLPLSLFL